jgi:TPR repeat protein
MAGNEMARNNLGNFEVKSGNIEQAIKHWTIAALAGKCRAMHKLRICFEKGGLLQDQAKGKELLIMAAELGSSQAHYNLAVFHLEGGDMKKARFHWEAAAMAGHEVARNMLGNMELKSGNMERAVKHWTIAASAGSCHAMQNLLICFKQGSISRHEIDSTLAAYNSSCAEMRSEARDAYIRAMTE